MGDSPVWYKDFIIVFAALQFHAVSIGFDGNQVIELDIEAPLFALEDETFVRDIQDAPVGLILDVVFHVCLAFAVVVLDIMKEDTRIGRPAILPHIAFLDYPLLINGFIDIVATFSALEKDPVCVQDRQTSRPYLIDRRRRQDRLNCRCR